MDAAKQLTQWKERSPEDWLKAANRYLPTAVTALLVLAIAFRLAQLTWLLIPGVPADAPAPVVAVSQGGPGPAAGGTDFSNLQDWHPFGVAASNAEPDPQPVQVVDAPDTTLALILTGVQARDDAEAGTAFISGGRAEQKFYRVGDSIEGANGATLHSVFGDRVLINRNGRVETLRFPQELSASRVPSPAARLAPPMPQAGAQAPGGSLRDVISSNASRITEIVRAAPQLESGQMIGYRITPGRDREAFAELGFEPGDVLTDVNGTALNDMATSLQVFESLGEASMATVTVLREGAPQVVVVDMSQVQNVAEDVPEEDYDPAADYDEAEEVEEFEDFEDDH
jgi:general secretion pathway protein C